MQRMITQITIMRMIMMMVVVVRQWKLQRERLQADFTKALDNFQRAQRSAAQKEKDAIKKYKNQGVRQLLKVAGHIGIHVLCKFLQF